MATVSQVSSEKNFEVFETSTLLPSPRNTGNPTDESISNGIVLTSISKESSSSIQESSSSIEESSCSTVVKSEKTTALHSTAEHLDDKSFPATADLSSPNLVKSVKCEYIAKIRTIEELLDSTSDLDSSETSSPAKPSSLATAPSRKPKTALKPVPSPKPTVTPTQDTSPSNNLKSNGYVNSSEVNDSVSKLFSKTDQKAKIRTVEELLDSSSDLDLPTTPPPPVPSDTSSVAEPASSSGRLQPSALKLSTVQNMSANPICSRNGASSDYCASKVSNDSQAIDRLSSVSPTPTTATISTASGGISVNHYERLIEELKCPGCASPMKAPIKLCANGHSICQNCTTVLTLCPLCKESFIELRSLTLEALCSKAHFRCCNAAAGCTVRLQIDLLSWHEKQCIWKPMKCFMGRVWGDCSWTGREAGWKDHLELAHADKVFTGNEVDLVWNMNGKIQSLAGYYVFEVYNEMFNFYQVYDRDRILFTMTVTSTARDRKLNFAYEVEMFHKDNEALSITQRFPVHSEYDKDILLDGTCVCLALSDLARLIDRQKILHFRVRIHEVKSPKKGKAPKKPSRTHPIDFQQTNIEGANLKCVPPGVIVTRKLDDAPLKRVKNSSEEKDAETSSSEDPEFEAFIEKNWGTPQMNFNRKFLKSSTSKESTSSSGSSSLSAITEASVNGQPRQSCEAGPHKSKMKHVTSSLRKSFRSLKTDIIDMKKPFVKKSPEKKDPLIKN